MNCDHSLLTYSFYKQPSFILRLFQIRLREIMKINAVPALVIGGGLALILLSGFLPDKAEKQTDAASVQSAETASQEQAEQYCRRREQQLVDVLEQVEGVGSCRVMLTATGSPETIYAQDAEQEQGENRTRIQRKCVSVSDSGSQQPLVQQIAAPEISGVIVVCSGASSAVVQERVTKAVQAVLHLAAGRICVVPAA